MRFLFAKSAVCLIRYLVPLSLSIRWAMATNAISSLEKSSEAPPSLHKKSLLRLVQDVSLSYITIVKVALRLLQVRIAEIRAAFTGNYGVTGLMGVSSGTTGLVGADVSGTLGGAVGFGGGAGANRGTNSLSKSSASIQVASALGTATST